MTMQAGENSHDTGVTVRLFAGLRYLFGQKESRVAIGQAADIGRLLEALCTTPEQRHGLLDESGGIREGFLVLLNGHNIAFLGGAGATLHDGDEVAIFPPIAGG